MEIFLLHLSKVSGQTRSATEKTSRFGKTSYVASVGTCQVILKSAWDMNTSHMQGDSGGPSFVEESKDNFVVTGDLVGNSTRTLLL